MIRIAGAPSVAVAAAAHHPRPHAHAHEEGGEHGEEARDRHHGDVAVGDVGELVREHALDLLGLEPVSTGPAVTATAACFGLRPVANAFGTSVGMIATRGFGRSAMAQSRSTIACSSRRLVRLHDLRAGRRERDLVGRVVLEEGERRPAAPPSGGSRAGSTCTMNDEEDDVERPEQEHGQEHAGGEPEVASVCLASHGRSLASGVPGNRAPAGAPRRPSSKRPGPSRDEPRHPVGRLLDADVAGRRRARSASSARASR